LAPKPGLVPSPWLAAAQLQKMTREGSLGACQLLILRQLHCWGLSDSDPPRTRLTSAPGFSEPEPRPVEGCPIGAGGNGCCCYGNEALNLLPRTKRLSCPSLDPRVVGVDGGGCLRVEARRMLQDGWPTLCCCKHQQLSKAHAIPATWNALELRKTNAQSPAPPVVDV
jgi:hypothetical protein